MTGDKGPTDSPTAGIGTLNEGSLHASLKELISVDGDQFEYRLDGFVIDVRRDNLLIEIQTGSFGALGRKLDHLLGEHRVLLIHPIATTTYLHRPDRAVRRSPKKGSIWNLFDELVRIPTLIDHPNLTIEAWLVTVDRIQQHDPSGRRGRGGWKTLDRQLRTVEDQHRFETADDVLSLLPEGLPDPFTTADVASSGQISRASAQKLLYCLRALGRATIADRKRSGYRYTITPKGSA